MWLRRRPRGELGAPVGIASGSRPALLAAIVVLAMLLPLFGLSLLLVLLVEYSLLRRSKMVARWLGLNSLHDAG